jgi:cytochrome bd-type quinol oxidase subunit 2
MGLFVIMAVLGFSSWILVATVRRLRRKHANRSWWLAFGSLLTVGIVCGYWLAFHFEYQVSATMRFFSFPLPLCFVQLENGRWTDFPTPAIVMYPGLVANVMAVTAFAALPLLAASLVLHRGGDKGHANA